MHVQAQPCDPTRLHRSLKTLAFYGNNPGVFRKSITVCLLSFWLLGIWAESQRNDNPEELWNAHGIIKPDLLTVVGAIRVHELNEKKLAETVSGVTVLSSAVKRVGLQRSKEICQRSNKSHKIYAMNRAFLI